VEFGKMTWKGLEGGEGLGGGEEEPKEGVGPGGVVGGQEEG
jgi:hypothetical protein